MAVRFNAIIMEDVRKCPIQNGLAFATRILSASVAKYRWRFNVPTVLTTIKVREKFFSRNDDAYVAFFLFFRWFDRLRRFGMLL